MKIVEIQFKFFCGASWADKEVMILAETKEQAFEEMFQVTNPIHLERSLKHGVMYPKDELLQIPQPTGIFQPSLGFGSTSRNCRPVRTRFPCASPIRLSSLRNVSR